MSENATQAALPFEDSMKKVRFNAPEETVDS
jgi:hypothetical protein